MPTNAKIFFKPLRMRWLAVTLTAISALACGQRAENAKDYLAQVGDIVPNAALDDPNFAPCHEPGINQYYNFGNGVQYRGEKPALTKFFADHLRIQASTDESGYITIRFIVNCKGETGRFRIETMDKNMKPKKFNGEFTDALLDMTRQLDGWLPGVYEGREYDYYQYLTFKIEQGKLVEILP